MSIRTIVTFFRSPAEASRIISAATRVAALADRPHIIGVYAIPAPSVYADFNGFVDTSLIESQEQRWRADAGEIEGTFAESMRREAISCEFRTVRSDIGTLSRGVASTAMLADLVIAGQVDPGDTEAPDDRPEALVLESGRPVLFVPFGFMLPDRIARVLIAFNGTREAARAAFDALPFLKRAESVEIVWVNARDDEDQDAAVAGADFAQTLARHDVNVTASGLTSHGLPVDETIRQRAIENADLLVMGAYGHSRLREMVFGGVTRSILEDMPCMTLMSR